VPLHHTFFIVSFLGAHLKNFYLMERKGFGGPHLGLIFSIIDEIIEDILIIEGL
jgi:hypothetical protein